MQTHFSTYCPSLSHLDSELLRKGFYSNQNPLFALFIQVFSYRLNFLGEQLLALLKNILVNGRAIRMLLKSHKVRKMCPPLNTVL